MCGAFPIPQYKKNGIRFLKDRNIFLEDRNMLHIFQKTINFLKIRFKIYNYKFIGKILKKCVDK